MVYFRMIASSTKGFYEMNKQKISRNPKPGDQESDKEEKKIPINVWSVLQALL